MKKFLFSLVLLVSLIPSFASAQLTVPQGGTGLTTIPTNYVLMGSTTLRTQAVSTSSFATLMGGLVRSISSSGGSLVFSPTSGVVNGTINPDHSNTWYAPQSFGALDSSTYSLMAGYMDGTDGTFRLETDRGVAGDVLWVYQGSPTYNILEYDSGAHYFNLGGNETAGSFHVGVGVVAPAARFHVISTAEQIRSGYNTSNYWNATTGSTGRTVFNAVGASSTFSFSDPVLINRTAPFGVRSRLEVLSVDDDSTTEMASFCANNQTQCFGITYNGLIATGTNSTVNLNLQSKNGTGNITFNGQSSTSYVQGDDYIYADGLRMGGSDPNTIYNASNAIGIVVGPSLYGTNITATTGLFTAYNAGTTDGSLIYHAVIRDMTTSAIGTGGGIGFSNSLGILSGIQGFKENSIAGSYAGAIGFYTRVNSGNLTERMRVASAGQVSIGTTASTSQFVVRDAGNLNMNIGNLGNGSGYMGIAFTDTPSSSNYSFLGDSAGNTYFNASGVMTFRIANSDKMWISNTGLVGIGTTNPSFLLSLGSGTGNKIGVYDGGGGAGFGFGVQSGIFQMFSQSVGDRVGIGYGNSASFTETLSVKGATVGIGTSTPISTLSVKGTGGTNLFTVASSTGAKMFEVDSKGHIVYGGSTPTVSSCGTSPSLIGGNDVVGRIQVGSVVATSCTLTFAQAWTNPPVCDANVEGGLTVFTSASSTATALLITGASAITGDVITYQCHGY